MTPLIELRRVSVSFGATRALDDVSFAVNAGEVHVLAGENGAGKSTLLRVLSGVVAPQHGEVLVSGAPVRLRSARDAARSGVATIHQELSLVGSMTVAENLALASDPARASLFRLLRRDDEAAARRILATMELDVDPRALVESLPLSTRQMIEIARALARDARVLILDEPTSALEETDAERLLARVERLAESGRGVVYVSHRMEENDRLADRVTVLRDGRVVACRPASELPREELVALMMGAPRAEDASHESETRMEAPSRAEEPSQKFETRTNTHEDEPLLGVRGLTLAASGAAPLHDVTLSVGRGEIVGLAGLRGSGTSETLAALFGVHGSLARGEVRLGGAPFEIASPARSITQGLVCLANDRRKTVLPDLTIAENITLSSLAAEFGYGLLSPGRERAIATEQDARLHVVASSLESPARALSGGNQQKTALLRCLAVRPRALLLDEPTRGVDIGAKSEIHRTLRALADEGIAILVVTSELPELLSLCDRIVVLRRGRTAATLEKKDFSRDGLRLSLDG
ncbi:MAG: sugar ABC transporter ATP-binding protein [Polyangiaceae bacterium]